MQTQSEGADGMRRGQKRGENVCKKNLYTPCAYETKHVCVWKRSLVGGCCDTNEFKINKSFGLFSKVAACGGGTYVFVFYFLTTSVLLRMGPGRDKQLVTNTQQPCLDFFFFFIKLKNKIVLLFATNCWVHFNNVICGFLIGSISIRVIVSICSADIAAAALNLLCSKTARTIKEKKTPQWDVGLQATKELQSVWDGAKKQRYLNAAVIIGHIIKKPAPPNFN